MTARSVPSCSTAGIIGALAGIVGSAMAMETIKVITGSGKPFVGEVGLYSGLNGEWKYMPLLANTQALPQKNAESHSERRKEPENRVTFRNNLVFLDTVSEDSTRPDISAAELQDVMSRQKVVVIDVLEPSISRPSRCAIEASHKCTLAKKPRQASLVIRPY